METAADIFKKIETHQRNAIRAISEVTKDCKSSSRPLYEIGDQLVYLKYYAACCFQVEKDAMMQFGYMQFENHRKNHDNVLDNLKNVLGQCTAPQAETPVSKTTLLNSIVDVLTRLQEHITKHNLELTAFLTKQMEQPSFIATGKSVHLQPVQQELAKLDKYCTEGLANPTRRR